MRRALVGLVLVVAGLTATGCDDPCQGHGSHTELRLLPVYVPGEYVPGVGRYSTGRTLPGHTELRLLPVVECNDAH